MQTNERTSKNGIESTTTQAGERTTVSVAGGVLVYEHRQLGKELVGFRAVEDWDAIANALRARGHGTGAIHHLPELDR
jgi:hypothetical protein